MDQVISEALRLSGPAFLLLRECTEETVIKGVRFSKGVGVNIPTYVLHHDPEVWDKPQEFNPDNFSPEAKQKRDPYSYLPFGTGPRQCIGMRSSSSFKFQVSSLLRKVEKIQNMMYHCSQLAIAIRGEQWLDTK